MGVIFGTPRSELIGAFTYCTRRTANSIAVVTNHPLPGVTICADADPDGGHWIVFYWVTILAIDIILLALALRKALEHRHNKLMRETAMRSLVFFVA